MADSQKAVALVVGLLVAGLMAAFVAPVAIDAIAAPEEATYTQSVDETVELQPGLNSTVTSVTNGTSATYTIDYDGNSVTGETVNVGANSTVTVGDIDVTIDTTDATATNATTDYTYPTSAGWGGGAGSLWGILPVIFVLAIFLYLVWMAMDQF